MKRVILIVLDSVGIGELPDAGQLFSHYAPPDAAADPSVVHKQINGAQPPVAIVLDDEGRLQGYRQLDEDVPNADGVMPAPEGIVVGQASLKEAMAMLLLADDGWLPVADAEGRYLGALTADAIHRATRASLVDADAEA